jgi:hypothetical protein
LFLFSDFFLPLLQATQATQATQALCRKGLSVSLTSFERDTRDTLRPRQEFTLRLPDGGR